jgi:EAL domain-containing protein (putative c-di-GMP-specific phosphodiesterase class I)
MFDNNDYYTFLESVSSAVVVLKPVCNEDGIISDFRIDYMNRSYKDLFRGIVKNGQAVSELPHLAVSDKNWLAVGVGTIINDKMFTTSYYSPIAKTYFYMTARGAAPAGGQRFCILTLTDLATIKTDCVKPEYRELHEQILHKTVLRKRLQQSSGARNFELHFQPQFKIKENKLRGFEALLRWSDEQLGQVSPKEFIPVAEESLAIIDLGYWVLDTAVQTLKQWQKYYSFDGIMSVNVSPVQLTETDFSEKLLNLLQSYDISPDSIEIEVTENIFIANMEEIVQILSKLRKKGVLISLDDFGTGYSSFLYLQRIPVTTIKIDKSFISNLVSPDSKDAVIADAIISIASKLGLETIAEGVEYESQLAALKDMNCTTVQGFLYGKPMAGGECTALLNIYKNQKLK